MPEASNPRAMRCWEWAATVVLPLLLVGCSQQKQPVYEDGQGLRMMPPPGWVERARDNASPARYGQRRQNLPLPPLDGPGISHERFLVRYDRISTAKQAWLRVTVADLPSSTSLQACLSTRFPGRDWKCESQEVSLDVSGLPAARIAFLGRWYDQDYVCETTVVRKKERVYFFSAAFLASDDAAREQARQAVLSASWPD